MRTRTRTAVWAALAALVMLGIGAASRAPWTASATDSAVLRLSWRAPSEVAEECRPLSAEEKADLPVHMQVPEVCETRAVPYLLEVRIDGAAILADTVHGTGAREDRPIYVFREIALQPGAHALDIGFAPIRGKSQPSEASARGPGGREKELEREDDDGHEDEIEEGGAVALVYSGTIDVGAREVALIAFDPGRRALVRVTGR